MLTGPIFSPEDEDDMMDFEAEGRGSAGGSDPRARATPEGRRGTVILEGEDEAGSGDRMAGATAAAEEVYHTPPNVVPHDYHYSEEYEFSFDFTAPTHVYSIQLSPQNEEPPVAPGGAAAIAGTGPRKHPWLLWASAGLVAALCGAQQLAHVKHDLATLRLQNEQLQLTIEALQQEKMEEEQGRSTERPYRQMVEDCFPAAAAATDEVKKHLFYHFADLKETFWMTAEQVRDFIEEELLGPVPQEHEEPDLHESAILQWFNKTGLTVKKTIDKTVRQVTSPKVWAPLVFMSAASLIVHWIGHKSSEDDAAANDFDL